MKRSTIALATVATSIATVTLMAVLRAAARADVEFIDGGHADIDAMRADAADHDTTGLDVFREEFTRIDGTGLDVGIIETPHGNVELANGGIVRRRTDLGEVDDPELLAKLTTCPECRTPFGHHTAECGSSPAAIQHGLSFGEAVRHPGVLATPEVVVEDAIRTNAMRRMAAHLDREALRQIESATRTERAAYRSRGIRPGED